MLFNTYINLKPFRHPPNYNLVNRPKIVQKLSDDEERHRRWRGRTAVTCHIINFVINRRHGFFPLESQSFFPTTSDNIACFSVYQDSLSSQPTLRKWMMGERSTYETSRIEQNCCFDRWVLDISYWYPPVLNSQHLASQDSLRTGFLVGYFFDNTS